MSRLNIGGDPEFLPIFFSGVEHHFVPAHAVVSGGLGDSVGVDEDRRKGETRPKHVEEADDPVKTLFKNYLFEYLKANGMVKKYNALRRRDEWAVGVLTGEIEATSTLTVAGHFHIGSSNKEIQEILSNQHAEIGRHIDNVGVEDYLNTVDDPSRLSSRFGRGPDTTRQKPYGFEYRRVMGRAWMVMSLFRDLWVVVVSAVANYLATRHRKIVENILKKHIPLDHWESIVKEEDPSALKSKILFLTPTIQKRVSPSVLYLPIGITDDWEQENALELAREFMRSPYKDGYRYFLFFGLAENRGPAIFIHNEHRITYTNRDLQKQKEVYIGLPAVLRTKPVDAKVFRELVSKIHRIVDGKKDKDLEVVIEDGKAVGIREVERRAVIPTIISNDLSQFEIPK